MYSCQCDGTGSTFGAAITCPFFSTAAGATIYFTTDGTEPTADSPTYRRFRVSEGAGDVPPGPRHVSMLLSGKWYDLAWDEDPSASPVERLDVARLQKDLLAPVLGIEDPRRDERIWFVGGIRGTKELVRLVEEEGFAVAFSMHPVTVEQLMDIADAGEIMPPKSTWFEPKLRTGLLTHVL